MTGESDFSTYINQPHVRSINGMTVCHFKYTCNRTRYVSWGIIEHPIRYSIWTPGSGPTDFLGLMAINFFSHPLPIHSICQVRLRQCVEGWTEALEDRHWLTEKSCWLCQLAFWHLHLHEGWPGSPWYCLTDSFQMSLFMLFHHFFLPPPHRPDTLEA